MQNKTKTQSKFVPVKRGSGEITGYIEVFLSEELRWVTIPGVSRFVIAGEVAR